MSNPMMIGLGSDRSTSGPSDVSLQRLVLHLGRECDGCDPCLLEKIRSGDGVPGSSKKHGVTHQCGAPIILTRWPMLRGGETKLQTQSRDRHRRSGSSQPCDRCPRTNGF
ncbi:MAG: hypothetical protein Ct9H90mP9_2690 [Pseudomonadota bacterium]|nr:MAG: hypothetical protein Ct9H90mP9_2690 [Pseudomonadota bacterium]